LAMLVKLFLVVESFQMSYLLEFLSDCLCLVERLIKSNSSRFLIGKVPKILLALELQLIHYILNMRELLFE